MSEPKFKVKDKVICIENNSITHKVDMPGSGWIKGCIGTIKDIRPYRGIGLDGYIYFSKDFHGGCGVWEPFLELYKPKEFKIGDKVKLIGGWNDSEINPIWGGKCGKIIGTIVMIHGNGFNFEVEWLDGIVNNCYTKEHLKLIEPEESPIIQVNYPVDPRIFSIIRRNSI